MRGHPSSSPSRGSAPCTPSKSTLADAQHPGGAAGCHHLHYPLRFLPLLEQLVHFLRRRAAAGGDAAAPAAVDHLRVAALLRRHREDDGLGAPEKGIV